MCGIFAYLSLQSCVGPEQTVKLFNAFNKLKERGPDYTSFQVYEKVVIGFHRLAIMEPTFYSNQPFFFEDNKRTVAFICNGEFYNCKELAEEYQVPQYIKNDCHIIGYILYDMIKNGKSHMMELFVRKLEGEFAFMLFQWDEFKTLYKVTVVRDQIGIRPLYYHPYSEIKSDALLFTSLIRGGDEFMSRLEEFPPGTIHMYHINELGGIKMNSVSFCNLYEVNQIQTTESFYLKNIEETVLSSVRKRLIADQPIGFLLSGGVDSSLVAALSSKILKKRIETYCIGMEGGSDFEYARKVAKYIGSNHNEIVFTPEQVWKELPNIIRTVESWDTTTIRASVGQYLIAKYISKHTDRKVIMVGEGPDEVCSSYLYNWYAPNGVELDEEAKSSVRNIHCYDVKRVDRCMAHFGLEVRIPLLDPEFIREYWTIPKEERMPTDKGIEKWWFRKAFDCDILPDEVLWRKKEAFSDGVSGVKSWYEMIQEWVKDKVPDEEMEMASIKYPYHSPKTKESYYYRKVFCEEVGEIYQELIPGYWQPKWVGKGYVDPSARILSVYS